METVKKMAILADSAKYDVSCSSSGSNRKNSGGVGNGALSGICHSWSEDGRCISLLKTLYTNNCVYDCAYCINRISNDIPRASFTPRELADLTIDFYRRNYIEGLFLSSGVYPNPDKTMENLIETMEILRKEYKFFGYIHVKAIPGADPLLINKAGMLADRMSVNIELPSEKSLRLLAPQKSKEKIFKPMAQITQGLMQIGEEKGKYRFSQKFVPAGQSTQMIVGATNDTDLSIISLSQGLYDNFKLKRVYYSAYVPVNEGPNLPALIQAPPMKRENRLYQADWLLRFYGFKASELLDQDNQNFDMDLDPKCDWAIRHFDFFPVEINKASYNKILRVPGIGVKSAKKIIKMRKFGKIDFLGLKKLGVVLKRAKYFITCNGRYSEGLYIYPENLRNRLIQKKPADMQIKIFQESGL
ncbi:MAG: putative DNA modification/repair radical SAM protein [Eubacteriales bacterium]|nr:putative DNA modification/repair radical SAM protein [Eubacteriales bacterium]